MAFPFCFTSLKTIFPNFINREESDSHHVSHFMLFLFCFIFIVQFTFACLYVGYKKNTARVDPHVDCIRY